MVNRDEIKWYKVGENKGEHDFTIKLDNVHAQYVKRVVNTANRNWVLLNEVNIHATKDPNATNSIIEVTHA